MTIFRSISATLLAACALLIPAQSVQAGQAMSKYITPPAGSTKMSEWSRNPSSAPPAFELRGFRSASDGQNAYQTGNMEGSLHDGWIAKTDNYGNTLWAKSMKEIVGASPFSAAINFDKPENRGFLIYDVIYAQNSVYVCGQSAATEFANDGWGYVARLTSAGALQAFTLFRSDTAGDFKPSRAVALASVVSGGNLIIGVAGDFGGTTLSVTPNFGPNTTNAFAMNGRMDNGSERDVFGITLDASLAEPQKGWTLGFNVSNEYASAAALDGNGDLMVAMSFKNPDSVNSSLNLEYIDDSRSVWTRQPNGSYTSQGFTGFPDNYDFANGDFASIVKVNGTNATVALHAEPVRLESGESGSSSHITDMVEDGGSLYILGHWSRHLRPSASTFPAPPGSTRISNGNSQDVFMARLSATDFGWQKIVVLNSPNEDVAGQLVLSADAIYVTGSAGGSFTYVPVNPAGPDEVLNSSSSRHLFWTKIDRSTFAKTWHTLPFVSSTLGIGLANTQNSSGLSLVGDRILLTAANPAFSTLGQAPLTHTMGILANRKTMPAETVTYLNGGTPWNIGGVFNALIKTDGVYQEEASITITSAYGQPQPFKGTQNMAAGQSLRIAVAPIVYENAAGTILDGNNAELLRTSAVTRRICTGYTVRNTTLNGTASELDYKLDADSEITFLWRTEHALEVKTNLPVGLTSEAAGLPSPEVNKHWIASNNPVIAQIDGSAAIEVAGVRYRSTGYVPTGTAVPAGGTAGTLVPWPSYQIRQQVPQFTLTAPATVTWQWQKELSIRVSTIPSAASGAATITSPGAPTATGDGEFWFAPGASLTLTSPPLRDANRLTLQTYANGTGSVVPSTQTANAGVLSKTITLDTGSSITWNYGKTPVPQRVTIGDPIVWTGLPTLVANTQPLAIVVVSDAPPGTTSANSMAWEPLGRRLLPLRPGKYLLEFNDPAVDAASTNSEDNVIAEVVAGFQGDPVPNLAPVQNFAAAADATTYQTYIATSPAVALDSAATTATAWRSNYTLTTSTIQGLALAGGDATVNGNSEFIATEPGTSVLVFTQAATGNIAQGNLETESVFLRVVRTRRWNDPAVLTASAAVVGTAIAAPESHNESVIGHNGYVVTARARYNVSLHNNATFQGPIFPVNTQFTGQDGDKLAVVWFNRDGKISANWPSSSIDYSVTWPAITPRIVIASRLGSEGLAGTAAGGLAQTPFVAPRYTNLAVYAQNDHKLPGYNPNEEHAFTTASFLDASRTAVFALQNNLNRTTQDATFTSLPFVLVQYSETIGTVTTPLMAVYAVEWQDAAVTDTRLPAYNQTYAPKYQAEAGKQLTPPWPLPILYGVSGWPAENVIIDQDPAQRSAWQDRKKQWWAASGDTDVATEVDGAFQYPVREGFWHPIKRVGEIVPLSGGEHVFFNTIWPTTIPVLKNGETLTHSGGEAFSDGATTNGLPSVVGMASAEVIYDHANRPFTPASMADAWIARVVNPIVGLEVDLPLSSIPDDLKPASGNVIVDGLLWRFKGVHAGLQKRLYYDSQRGKLGFRGYLNGRTTGDQELTAAPPAINLLQPNIMTAAEKTLARGISSAAAWQAAVDSLFLLTVDPAERTGTRFTPGLSGTSPNFSMPAQLGTGLAVISNPNLADPAQMSTVTSDGYVTLVENNHASLGDAPIALHVVRVDRTQKYRGAIAPVYPENVFDEKITLRHSGDFGGNAGNLVFQWYYREEDGTSANPPGVAFPSPPGAPIAGRWTLFGEIAGGNEISLSGASAALLADNLFFARWRHMNEPAVDASYSNYAGAANSRPPVLTSPSVATDAAYVAQLAEGWIKRVTNGVNPFDARISDFRNNGAPSTNVSMLQQAGGRWEGNVAFNPSKDAIENYGLIELYQTVLNRGTDLSINLQPGTSGVNTALLNAANRISTLYTMLGNEASTDALDPTIGFGTQSGQYGNLAPSIHCFQNQVGSLLDEELALLRGRGEVGARPAYNHLMWNFTNGEGEAAYATNYGITDVDNDGFVNANDAARLYPQGHGDAWGHYTMALKGYANLFRNANYAWDTRSEKYQINGIVFDIDYLDERTFAAAAAARAKAGAEIVDLVYRQKYTDNPAGQWQGYQDTNTDRAWGVFEWSQRAGSGAFFDWVTANALLPSKDETKEGVTRVDRTTVTGLKLLASNATTIQSKLDQSDNALNPLGLDADAVPFDIDPVRTDRNSVDPATHFEQVYERALAASQNAVLAFDHANEIGQMLRRTAGSAEELRQQTIDQDRDYRNRLIELLGTPYQGQIGAGKAYPAGYSGPDLFLFMYANTVEVSSATVPATPTDVQVKLNGLLRLATDANPFTDGVQALPDYAKSYVTNWFPNDYPTAIGGFGGSPFYTFTVPAKTSGYAFKAPAEWGVRSSPGKVQAALSELLQAEYNLLIATEGYEGYLDDANRKLRVFTAKTGLAGQDIDVVNTSLGSIAKYSEYSVLLSGAALSLSTFREALTEHTAAIVEAVPEDFGNFSAPLQAAIKFASNGAATSFRALEFLNEFGSLAAEDAALRVEFQLQIDQTKIAYQAEVIDMLEDLEAHFNLDSDLRLAIFQATEHLRSAGDRYRAVLQEGLRLVEEREAFNKRVAATTTQQRYEDFTFRIARNEALGKYRTTFDLATRYAWLAGRAYAYELNLPDSHAANPSALIAGMLRTRTLGHFEDGVPVSGDGGLAEQLATLKTNFDVFKGQLGFNAPATQTISFSLRTELARIGLSSRVNNDWRTQLETYRVADIWNYNYSRDGVDYGQIFRRHCRPFAPESAGPQAALVIPFSSTITSGENWFGKTLTGGDSTFTATNFATKVRSAGVKFESYNSTALSVTPQVYLVPVGLDRMYLPESNTLESRSWRVLDQRIPVPLAITPSQLADPGWLPFTGSTSGYFEEARRHPAFRAYHDAGGYSNAEMLASSRLVGRSVWNTQWVLIVPTNALLSDPGDVDAGLDTLIYGAPLPTFTHATAGTTNRDGNGVRDIRLLFQTYSFSGN